MRGIVNHEKRNMLIITLAFTFIIWILSGTIISDIAGSGDQLNNFYGNLVDDYGNLFLGTLDQYYTMLIIALMLPISFVALMQYRESSISKSGEFLMQLPVKRGAIFFIRTVIGMMTYTIPWFFFSAEMILTRWNAQSWYEMKLSVCKKGELLLGNDSLLHLCAYLFFIWLSMTVIYVIAVFFQNICKRPWIAAAIGMGAMIFPTFMVYIMPKIVHVADSIQSAWWTVPFFQKGAISEVEIWDDGVHQNVKMAVFDNFSQILLIQILCILLFLAVSFYVFKKSDMTKRNQFMYFAWMEHLFVWITPFCFALFVIVIGFKCQSYEGGIAAGVIATIVYYIVEKRKKRRAA